VFFNIGSNIDNISILTNCAIWIIGTILKHVMSSAVEAYIGSVFLNKKEATLICTPLEEM
jgi:hypothetical protein